MNNHEIEKMKDVLRLFEKKELKTSENGKILLEDKNDINDFIRLLNDYYKQGMITGKYYGSNAGIILNV